MERARPGRAPQTGSPGCVHPEGIVGQARKHTSTLRLDTSRRGLERPDAATGLKYGAPALDALARGRVRAGALDQARRRRPHTTSTANATSDAVGHRAPPAARQPQPLL